MVEVDVSDPLEHLGLNRADDVVPGLVLPEPLEHLVLVIPLEKGDVSVTDITVLDPFEHSGVGVRTETISAYFPRVYSGKTPEMKEGGPWDHRGEDVSLPDPCRSSDGPNRRMGRPLLWGPSARRHPGSDGMGA